MRIRGYKRKQVKTKKTGRLKRHRCREWEKKRQE